MTRTLSTLPSPVTAGDYKHTRSYFQPVVLTSRSYSRLENHLSNPFLLDIKIPTLLFHYNGLFLISFSHSLSHTRHYLSLSYTHIILYVSLLIRHHTSISSAMHLFFDTLTIFILPRLLYHLLSDNNQNNIHRSFFPEISQNKCAFQYFCIFFIL